MFVLCVTPNDFVNLEKYFLNCIFALAIWCCCCSFYTILEASMCCFSITTFYFDFLFGIFFSFCFCSFYWWKFFFLSLYHSPLVQQIAPAPITEAPLDLAKKCDSGACTLPYCFCSKDGTVIPGGLEAENVSKKTRK